VYLILAVPERILSSGQTGEGRGYPLKHGDGLGIGRGVRTKTAISSSSLAQVKD